MWRRLHTIWSPYEALSLWSYMGARIAPIWRPYFALYGAPAWTFRRHICCRKACKTQGYIDRNGVLFTFSMVMQSSGQVENEMIQSVLNAGLHRMLKIGATTQAIHTTLPLQVLPRLHRWQAVLAFTFAQECWRFWSSLNLVAPSLMIVQLQPTLIKRGSLRKR